MRFCRQIGRSHLYAKSAPGGEFPIFEDDCVIWNGKLDDFSDFLTFFCFLSNLFLFPTSFSLYMPHLRLRECPFCPAGIPPVKSLRKSESELRGMLDKWMYVLKEPIREEYDDGKR